MSDKNFLQVTPCVQARDVEVRPRLLAAGIAAGDGPVDQSWGQREFRVPVPEGGLSIFGQEMVRTPVIERTARG